MIIIGCGNDSDTDEEMDPTLIPRQEYADLKFVYDVLEKKKEDVDKKIDILKKELQELKRDYEIRMKESKEVEELLSLNRQLQERLLNNQGNFHKGFLYF